MSDPQANLQHAFDATLSRFDACELPDADAGQFKKARIECDDLNGALDRYHNQTRTDVTSAKAHVSTAKSDIDVDNLSFGGARSEVNQAHVDIFGV